MGECPICVRGEPLDIIASLRSSWLTMPVRAPLPGYVCLVAREHVVELHDFAEVDGASFMRDIQNVSRAVSAATSPLKMNYEIHGNTLPHLHVHFFPRHEGDQFEGGPIDARRAVQPTYASGEYERTRDAIVQALESLG
jgi:diadenosine tetraphosphate (Ap4A) HIT family hydrolase